MMAKVNIKGLDNVTKLIDKFLKNDITKAKTLLEIGVFVRDRIKSFTRTGKSIASGSPAKLKELRESYKAMRRGEVKFRKTKDGRLIVSKTPDEKLAEVDVTFFSPGRSNLTFSGQMLEAVKHKVNVKNRTVNIEVDDSSRSGKYETLTNKEVAQHVAANGRPFLGLDKVGIDRVKKIILASIRKELFKSRLKKR